MREPGEMRVAKAAPSGTVTFVLTDVEGSTKLARGLGDAYADLIGRHHAVLRSVWQEYDGYEVFTEGDAFIVAFADADDAVLAAVEAQRRIEAEPWPDDRIVRIRVGLHAGYARPVDGDYRALALNQAARIVDCAHGGQTFLTDEVATQLGEHTGTISLATLGKYRVRDFDAPVRLHAVIADDLPTVDAAPRVRPADGHNIVPPPTPLVGREADVDAVIASLAPRRTTTLAGPGGVGKTRLAVEIGIRAVPDWPDGVWFVDLTPIVSPDDVPSAIALAVGASVSAERDVWPDVLDHLEHRRALVVLDNCEHLIEAVARLTRDLIDRCHGCAVLATSRTPLGLVEERVRRLDALPVTDLDDAGVQLFLERVPTDSDQFPLTDVVSLCRELDGLPLAIELAAARTTAISPADILARLRSVPAVLQSRDPGLPERHRSLTRSLEWSYGLLEPPAQAVYRRLSAFAAGFDLSAAEHVCQSDELAAEDVAELVWSLVDASLVQPDESAGATRYRMLQVVRAHAAALADGEEGAAAMRQLADLEVERVGPAQPIDRSWLSAMAVELDNVRQVVVALAADDTPGGDVTAQTLVWSIGRYHDNTDAFRVGVGEVGRWIGTLTTPSPERAAMLAILADMHLRLGEADRAAHVLDEAVRLAATVGLPSWDEMAIERVRGEIALRRGDFAQAIAIAEAALPRVTTHRGRTRLLNLLGIAHSELGNNAAAAGIMREEIEAARSASMEAFLVTSFGNLAEILLRLGDVQGAATTQLDCLELSRSTGSVHASAFSMIVAAHLAASDGDWQLAVQLQSAADVELDGVGWAAYGADAERRRQLLDEARRQLGAAALDDALDRGRSLGIEMAADIAADELRRIAARQETPV